MEHPIFFITKLFEAVGLGHFAHSYPHVTYTWLIMLLLIVVFPSGRAVNKNDPGRRAEFL